MTRCNNVRNMGVFGGIGKPIALLFAMKIGRFWLLGSLLQDLQATLEKLPILA